MGWDWGGAFTGGLSGAGMGFLAGGPMGALAGGIGGFGMGGFMGGQDPYMRMGSPSDMTNVNPWSKGQWSNLTQDANYAQNWLKGSQGDYNRFGQNVQQGIGDLRNFQFTSEYDPLAAQRAFLASAPEYQKLVQTQLGGNAGQAQADLLSARAAKSVAGQFGSQGALNSGAAMKAMMEGAAAPQAQYMAGREQQYNGLLGGLLQGSQQGLGQGYWNQAQFNRQGEQLNYGNLLNQLQGWQGLQAGAAGQQQMAGNMFANARSGQNQMAAPTWWQPTYVANPNYASQGQIMGLGMQMGNALGGMDYSGMFGGGGSQLNQYGYNPQQWGQPGGYAHLN